ncbi:MAG: YbaY family lipoprotein [bacterium]|nr:YbaY family lipoprotein [bacterium]
MNTVRTIIFIAIIALLALGFYYVSQQAGPNVVTGTVSYMEDVPLPPNSVVEMRLLNVSLIDVESQVLSEQTIYPNGKNMPLPFSLKYRASNIDASSTYSVAARVLVNGSLAWVTTQTYPVITNGYPMTAEVYMTDVR